MSACLLYQKAMPPRQFDIIQLDLKGILIDKSFKRLSSLLDYNSDWIDRVQTEFESRSVKFVLCSGRNVIDDDNGENVMIAVR